ncbi:MAG: gliding motility-associated C-terminal domain-containing protein [Bacteroidia bacterium]
MRKFYFTFFTIITIVFAQNSLLAGEKYWVGGSGNWNNPLNWSHSSGGEGGAGVPSATDNVIFDNLSFQFINQEVVINSTAYCKNITVTSDVISFVFTAHQNALLEINGDVSFNGYFNNNFYGTIHFAGSGTKTINFSNYYPKGNIVFSGVNAIWNFNSHLILPFTSDITISSGTVNLSGKFLQANAIVFQGNLQKQLNISNATVLLNNNFSTTSFKKTQILSSGAKIKNVSNQTFNAVSRSIDSIQVNVVTPLCNTSCDGSITVTVFSPSSGPFQFDWSGGSLPPGTQGNPLLNVCNGTYLLTVTDLSDGDQILQFVQVIAPPPIGVTYNKETPTCNGDCNGFITANPVGGTPPYSYLWLTNGQTTQTATGLCAGTYQVRITDSNGCQQTFTTTLSQPAPINPNITFTDITCNAFCNGTASTAPTGGNPPFNYTYSWSPGGQTTQNLTNLCPGTYTVTVTDDSLCTGTATVTITQPNPLVITPSSNNISCFGACDGSVSVAPVSGGTPPYTFTWTPNIGNSSSINNLCPGTYTVVVGDAQGCLDTATFVLTEPGPVDANPSFTNVLCFGACDGTAISNPTGGTAPFTYSWSTGATSQSVNGLCPNQYTVTATDANGCSDTDTITITEPPLLTISVATTNVLCNGQCNGTATVTINGGTPGYDISWSNGQTTSGIIGLCAGNYSVTVTDTNGCIATQNFQITQPPPLLVSVNDTTISCSSLCDGVLTSTVSGGTSPYNYSWSNGQNGQNATNLCIGNYSLTVTDANGCTASDGGTVSNPVAIVPNATVIQNATCNGLCNGSATVNPTGGTAPYTYLWSNGQSSQTATGLCGGQTYTVTVTDALGCLASQTITITQPPVFNATVNVTNVNCFGQCTGQISLGMSGGTSPYSVVWNTTPVQTGTTAVGLCAGTYTATITDNNGCVYSASGTVTEPTQVQGNTTFTNVTCNSACDGTATANPSGGTPGYTYSWSPGGQTTSSVTSLCPGQYIVTITDALGCVDRDTINITEPLALNATITNVAATCSTACDGAATVLAGGGTPPYSYLWSTGATTQSVNNLCIGNYTVTVTDAQNCQITIPVSIVPVVNIIINTTGTQISCFGACDGQATATASGGTAPYTYSWNTSPVQNTQTAFGLCAGTYTVTVTDANGCFNTQSVTLNNPPQINLNITSSNATCGANCNGFAVANATGGTGTITYQWNTLPVTNGPTLNNLCAGTYVVTATDANGCSVTDSVTINAPVAIQPNPTITQSTCGNSDGAILLNPTGGTAPYTYLWLPGNSTANPLTGVPAGIYTAIITDAVACSDTFIIVVNNILGPIATTNSTDASCFGVCDGQISSSVSTGTPPFTYLWTPGGQTTPTATNLCDGVYTLTVTDALGCQGFAIDTINEPTQIFTLPTVTNVTCAGFCNGAITVNPTGGTAPYSYSWNTGDTTSTISNLCAGQYIVTVTDATGCSVNDTITVGNQIVINPNPISSNVTCNSICDGLAGVNPSGGTPPYNYVWSPSGPNAPSQPNLCAGTYTVTITDANGCSATQTFNISQPNAITLIPTITNNLCFGQSNGAISITASGGSGTYTYFWLPGGQTTSSISNLVTGNYTVTVSDPANPGCSETQTFTITEPPQLTVVATSTDASCNGVCDGTLSASANGGTGALTYIWTPGNLNGNAQAGVCAGSYTLTVTDANGCNVSANTTINQPTTLSIGFTSSNASCNLLCDGSASVNPTGGTAPYSVLWSTSVTTNNISNLCAGAYSVTVTDTNGCSVVNNFNITEPSPVSATFTTNNPLCGQCNGSATVTPSGGTGAPYSVTWNTTPVQNGVTASNLCAGLYDAIITDASGCSDTISVPVSNQGGPVTSHVSTDAVCNGDCNGTATVTATGLSPITYLWIPGGFTTNSQSALCANTYNVQVTDSLGCITFETIVINQPQPINSTATINNISCNGLCNGAITIATTGGTPGYTYQWSSGQTTQNINGLCVGQYIVTVEDNLGCIGVDTFNVTTPNVLSFTQSQSNISCGITCDGVATVNISGGTAPYSVVWSTTQTFTTNGTSTISGLCSGNYTANITDVNGCTATANFTINPATTISLNPSVNNVSCNGACNGSITIAPSGGNLPYNIVWSNGGSGNTISNLCPGVYSVSLTDASGCTASQTFTISEPTPLSASISSTNISCNAACDGQATVSISGGTTPYFFQWNGGQTSATINNLCPGNYSVQVIDSNGCTVNSNVQITQPSPIVITTTATQPPCGICNGALSASATGGSGAPYSFLWNTGATTSSISNLCAGLYNVTVTDNSGCSQQIGVPLSNSNGPAVTANVTNASCSGTCDGIAELTVTSGTAPFTFNWTPGGQTTDSIGGLCPGTYFATVTDAGNCITVQQVTIATSNPITATVTSTNATCGQCNGTASVSPSGGTAPFTYVWSNGATSQSVTGLCAGVYQVLITDANGCSITQNVSVGNSGGPTNAAITTTPVNCFGGSNGSASVVSVFGGTAPYSYLWVPGGQTTATVTGLAAGSYNVEIRDANGCIHVELVTITSPTQIVNTANISSTPCLASNGQISLTTSGGTAPYTYSWNTGQTTANISNLPSGIYIVTVTDAIGCSNIDTFFVNDIGAPLISVATTNIDCNGNCNGTATVTATGGSSGIYTYLWSPGGQTTSSINNLCAGNYVVQVTDAGCSSFATAVIAQPSGFSFSLPNVVDATCATACNGSATVLPIGGTLPYTYVWTPSGQTTQTANNLCAGLNSVAITDANGCTATQSVIVNDGLGVTATFTATNATCGQCNGSATITPTGGTAPYTFLWANGTTSATNSGLCAGVHAVQITDANGCSTTINVVINNTNAPSGVITAQTNVTCFGGSNGSATISASGGTSPYNFLWVPAGQTTATVNNLSAGTYNVEIQDAAGCIGIVPVTITQPTQMNVNPVITNATCGQCNGAVSIFVNGGTAPYSYAWSNGLPATSSQSGLCAQLYSVTVTDANGCSQTFAIPVGSTNGPNVVLTSNNVSCNSACDGSISATATGGSGNYSYLWTPGAQTSSSVNGLCPGTYVVQVTDNTSGCISFNLATITQPDSIHLSIPFSTNAACGGTCNGSGVVMPIGGTLAYTYSWSNGETTQTASALCAGNVSVTVTDANGCTATQNLTITEPPALVIDTLVTQPSCSNTNNGAIDVTVTGGNPPYSYQWSGASSATTQDLTNLFPGTYTLTVTDASGCSDTITVQLNPLQTITAVASADTAYCDGNGPATLSATGGTSYQWILLADGSVVGNTATVSVNPSVGVHTYIVQVNNGVCVAYDTVIVTVYALPVVDAGPDVSVVRGGSVLIGGNPTGPQGSTFAWAPSETLNSTTVGNPSASPVNNTTYYVTVTSPEGCIASDSVLVSVLPDIVFPNGFTPNGDGVNDVWIIDNIQFFPNNVVEVYNRWGELLFRSEGYEVPWDGRYNGKELPVGTYYYVIDLRDERYKPYTGPITIMR